MKKKAETINNKKKTCTKNLTKRHEIDCVCTCTPISNSFHPEPFEGTKMNVIKSEKKRNVSNNTPTLQVSTIKARHAHYHICTTTI